MSRVYQVKVIELIEVFYRLRHLKKFFRIDVLYEIKDFLVSKEQPVSEIPPLEKETIKKRLRISESQENLICK